MENKLVKVKGHADLVKDVDQNVVINKNMKDFAVYKMQREKSIENQELKKKVESMESDISDIKNLLQKLVEKNV